MSCKILCFGNWFTFSRASRILDFTDGLFNGCNEKVSKQTICDIRTVFGSLRCCVYYDRVDKKYTCLGVDISEAIYEDFDNALRDISIYQSFQKSYDKEVLDAFYDVLERFTSYVRNFMSTFK